MKQIIFIIALICIVFLCSCNNVSNDPIPSSQPSTTISSDDDISFFPYKGYEFSDTENHNIIFLTRMGVKQHAAEIMAYRLYNKTDCANLTSYTQDNEHKNNYTVIDENGRKFKIIGNEYLRDLDNNEDLYVVIE